jgi:hypothetical protein
MRVPFAKPAFPTRRHVAGGLAAAFALMATRDTSLHMAQGPALPGGLPAWDPEEMALLSARLRAQPLDVRRFGARGDGNAIDTRAINRAIAAARSGQTIYFPDGIYLVDNSDLQNGGASSTIPLPIGVNLLMEPGAWLKRAPSDRGGPNFITPTGSNLVQCNLDGDEFPRAGGMAGNWSEAECVGIYAADAADIVVVNSQFRHLTYGIEAHGLSSWRIVNCAFERIKLSGCLLRGSTGMAAVRNLVRDCRFFAMGDTAVALHYLTGDAVVAYNLVEDCTARDTQMRVDGYAFDVEGAYRRGTHHHNLFRRLVVEQNTVSGFVQGGATINKNSSDSMIVECQLRGNGAANGIGISIIETDGVQLINNRIQGFAANAIYADGAHRAEISGNTIVDSGDGASLERSTILLALAEGSRGARVINNTISWSGPNLRRGLAGAAIAGRSYMLNGIDNLVVRGNVIRNAVGAGILVEDRSSLASVNAIAVEGNTVVAGTDGVDAVAVRGAANVRIHRNRIAGTGARIDTTGSSGLVATENSLEPLSGSI